MREGWAGWFLCVLGGRPPLCVHDSDVLEVDLADSSPGSSGSVLLGESAVVI